MMSSQKGLRSTLLALAMLTAAPATTTRAEGACSLRHIPQTLRSMLSGNKAAFVAAAFVFAVHTRLHTRPRADFSMDDLKQDFKDLLDSLNIFDTKLYNQLVFMFDKYIIGLPVKIEDSTTRTIKEDGTIVAVKGKKLTQKPFGAYGLFDAYVLSQGKKFSDILVGTSALYI
jgi:hypothetical protein